MKKFFFIALCATCLMNVAQAQQHSRIPRPATYSGGVITDNKAEFKQKTSALKASLNANDFTKAQSQWTEIFTLMAKRGDEIRKVNNDVPGAQKRYDMNGKLKALCIDIPANKTALLAILPEIDATF